MNRNRTAISRCRLPKRIAFFSIFLFCIMLFCTLTAYAREVETDFGAVHTAAVINEKKPEEIHITLTPGESFLNQKKGETLYLFVLSPGDSVENLRTLSPAATKVVDDTVTFTVIADDAGERYRAVYRLALGEGADYHVVADAYVENPEVLAKNKSKHAAKASIKGLTVSQSLLSDAQLLGVSHAVIPIVMDRYLTDMAGDPQYSVSSAGLTNHFDPKMVQNLDAEIASLRETGVHIFFRFLLDGSARNTTNPASVLYDPASTGEASHYGISLKSKAAYQTANNIFTFFSERYAGDETADALDYIIGYQVNEWKNWYDVGYADDELQEQVASYSAVFRLADNALRRVSANSRVYVPLSNLYASAKPFLSAFAKEMGSGTAWSIAVAPYASDPMDDSIWDDANAQNSENSVYLTMKNLELLKSFLSKEEFLYNKKMRSVIIDDFAVHGTSGDTASQERQAASLIFAYEKAESLDFIDAMIWHRVIDGSEEHCSLGLRQLDGTEKPSYAVYAKIDTQYSAKTASEYAKIAGVKKWSSLIKNASAKKIQTASRYEGTAAAAEERFKENEFKEKTTLLWDFTEGDLHGFLPTEQGASAAISSRGVSGSAINAQVLQLDTFSASDYAYAGVTKQLTAEKLPKNLKTLYITLRADAPADAVPAGTTASVRLLLGTAGDTRILYAGNAEVPIGSFTTLAFDVSDFVKKTGAKGADYIKLLIGGITGTKTTTVAGTDGAPDSTETVSVGGTVSINEIRYDTRSGTWIVNVLVGILVVLLLLVLLFALLVLRAQIIRRKRRRQRAAYLAQQKRRRAQQMQQYPGRASSYQNTPYVHSQQHQRPQQQRMPSASAMEREREGEERRKTRTARRMPDMYYDPRK